MAALSLNNSLTTVIVIFDVKPERQQELIEAIEESLPKVKTQPGFVSVNLHKSVDGMKVVNYAQWESVEALQAFRTKMRSQEEPLLQLGKPDSRLYEIVASESKVGTPKIVVGQYFAHFAEFSMTPDKQSRMVKLAKEHIKPAIKQPGLVSATFHRSLDGTRVINYGQWETKEAIDELQKQPGFNPEQVPYWEGVAENEFHLYEVVYTETAA